MFFFSALVVVALTLGPGGGTASALSLCQTLDLEAARARRIQAVRGQILSKLQLVTPPEEEGVPNPLPAEVMLLYNSTQELVRELAAGGGRPAARNEEEDYYAKEVQRVDMLTFGHADNSVSGPLFRFMRFNLSTAQPILHSLVQAELRIYKVPNPGAQATEQLVELYQVMKAREPSASSQRYVGSHILLPRRRAEWVPFDVTETVRRRLGDGGRNLSFKLGSHCPCCTYIPEGNTIHTQHGEPLEVRFAGLDDDLIKEAWNGQSRPPDLSNKTPHLILTLLPPNRLDPAPKGRPRRAVNATSCSRNTDPDCCLHPLYIDFRKDLKWKWIHQPKGYKANFCAGSCQYSQNTNMPYNRALPLYKKLNPEASVAPCCVPRKLGPLTILYYVGRLPKVQQLSNMIVKSCRCR